MHKWSILFVVALWAFPSSGFAQNPLDQLDPLNPNKSGLRITDLSISSSYFSESIPSTSLEGVAYPAFSNVSANMSASAGIAWSKTGDRTTISITYSPSYARGFEGSNYHSINQSLGISATRRLTSKLTLAVSLHGLLSDFNQLLFASTLYGNVSAASATFDELVSGLLTGQSANPILSQLLGLAPVNGSPQTAFLYGARDLSAAASVSVLYEQSPRSSFSLSLDGMHTQYLKAGSNGSIIGPADLIPVTNSASASLGWLYSYSPRTSFGLDVSANRSLSRLADAYATEFTASVARTLSNRWFVEGIVGAGHIFAVHDAYALRQGLAPTFGGSIAYKFADQTLVGSYARTISDSYGLGAYSTQTADGAWSWSRRGSNISVSSGFGYTKLTGPVTFPHTTSWSAHASVSRRLPFQMFATAGYSYAQFPLALVLQAPNLAISGVNVGLTWSPAAARR